VQANDFDSQLLHLGYQMQIEVVSVLKLLLAFVSSFQPHHAHSMLVIIFDLHFKNLQLIGVYVGLELAMQVATNYDRKILMPPLLIVDHALTPNSTSITSIAFIVVELGVFGSLAFAKEVVMGFIKIELSFFKRIAMLIDHFNPFIWWAKHEQQF
jgi:hypothetical protein